MPIFTPLERLGTLLANRYRIDRILAVGGMGVVFAGRDLTMEMPVAVKVLKPHDTLEPARGGRFLQEAQLMVGLRHPHVVQILDFGQDECGAPYLVMELLEGESLESLLARRGTLSQEATLELLLPVLGALARVHDAGVVHRDVKPDNIFLSIGASGDTVPKLLDFGIAKAPDSLVQTREGAVVGTPEYMAPEQLAGHAPTPATDVWAAAALFYRCATGTPPYGGAHLGEVLARLSHEAPPRLDAPELPAGFRAAVERALSREASRRYANIRDFAAALVLTAREGGTHVPHALVSRAGLDGFDWTAKAPGARTVSSTALVRSSPALRWAIPALALSAVALGGWAAVRHPGAQATGAGSPPLSVEPAAAERPPSVSGAPSLSSGLVSTHAAIAKSLDGEPGPPPSSPRARGRSAPRVAPPSAVRAEPKPPTPVEGAAHRERDDLQVITEW
jgi:serine/threonine-protein kinase